MPEKLYLNLLIICVILSQVIGIIDNTPGGDQPVRIENVPYIVQITVNRQRPHCAGSILSPNIVITCAHCVEEALSAYTIFSGSSYIRNGSRHTIRSKIVNPTYTSSGYWDDLVLLVIAPLIDINGITTRKIELYEGPVPVNEQGTVSGWGCNRIPSEGRGRPDQLRSITVPIISLDLCINIYSGRHQVTTKNICTFDRTRKKRCDVGDSGAPLVARGKLIGVHGWNSKASGQINADVYMNLDYHEYKTWIMSTIASHSQIHHHQINEQYHSMIPPHSLSRKNKHA